MNTRHFVLLLCLLFTMKAGAQSSLIDLVAKGATDAAAGQGTKLRAALDSVDFQFSMSVNENAGFFDISQKGETGSKLLYGLKQEKDKTLVEKARDSLEIGMGLYDIRRYYMATQTVLRTKEFMDQHQLTDEVVYLRVLSGLGVIYLAQGKSAEAEKYIANALQKSAVALGKESAAYIANLNNYAKLHQSFGKYNEAEKEFGESLQLSQKVFGDGMQRAIILNNQAMLFQSIGRHEEAAVLMQQAMASASIAPKKALQGKNSFDNRKFQANLAFIYQISGDYPKAEENFLSIQKVFENRGQTANAEYAGLLNQLAILYIQMGKMDKVEELLKKSKETYRKKIGEQNPYFPKVANDLGNFYRLTGRYAEAEVEITKALSIREAWLGPKHPDYVKSQEDMAILYWKTNRMKEAYASYVDVLNKTIEFINEYFPPMSEAEKTSYWDILSPRFQRFFNFALDANQAIPAVARDFFNYRMATKALLLNSTTKVQSAILKSNDRTLINDYRHWVDQKEELVRLYSYSKKKLKDQNIDIDELKRSANAMEKSLSERSSVFASGMSSEKVTYPQLLNVLKEDEAVIDIIRINLFKQDFTRDVQYVALVATKGLEIPRMVTLEGGEFLEKRGIGFYRSAIKQKQDDPISYGKFWEKVEKEVQGIKMIYVSPDGVYNQVNLNTLKDPSGDYLIKQHDFVVLGNTKDLINLKTRKNGNAGKNALLVGFPDYQTDEVAALPGTKAEIEAVSSLLKKDGYAVNQLMQKEASEKNIKAAKNLSLLHIATHGYFMKDVQNDEGSMFGINAENADNPLLRSGLILAGAAGAIHGKEQVDLNSDDNGILYAYEAMNLNLEGTNLVILSACETGLGEVKSGEGVYGLQRAFIVAGAEALIMSLWKVDDEATQALMTNFYQQWLKSGNKQQAFKQAQMQLMQKYQQPYYWGAFVMMGM